MEIRNHIYPMMHECTKCAPPREAYQYEGAFVISAVSEKLIMQSNPSLLIAPRPPLYTVKVPTHPNVINLLTLMSHPTELERDAVCAYAEGLVALGIRDAPFHTMRERDTNWEARTPTRGKTQYRAGCATHPSSCWCVSHPWR